MKPLLPKDVKREIRSYVGIDGGMGPLQSEDDAEMKEKHPQEYKEALEDRRIIPVEDQKDLVKDEETMFDTFCRLGNAFHLPIYPEQANTPALINLEIRILNALRSIPTEEELSKVDPKRREKMFKLHTTDEEQKSYSAGVSLELTSIKKLGTHIIATEVWGYRGVLRYDHRDIFRGAPEEANAYWVGNAKLVVVIKNEKTNTNFCWSPLCYDMKLSPLDIRPEEYHVVPVQYFKVEFEDPKLRMQKNLRRLRDNFKRDVANTKKYYSSLQEKLGKE